MNGVVGLVKMEQCSPMDQEIQGATGDAWESLKEGAEKMWNDVAHTLKESKDAFLEGMHEAENQEL